MIYTAHVRRKYVLMSLGRRDGFLVKTTHTAHVTRQSRPPTTNAPKAACPAAPEESDLVPGVYEGGLKVWEASLDLVQHLFASGIGTARQRQADDEGGNYRDAQAPLGEVGGGEVGGGGGREGCGDASSSSCSGGGGSRGGDGSACSNLPGRERLFDAVEGGGERQGVGAPASTGRRRRVLEVLAVLDVTLDVALACVGAVYEWAGGDGGEGVRF